MRKNAKIKKAYQRKEKDVIAGKQSNVLIILIKILTEKARKVQVVRLNKNKTDILDNYLEVPFTL